MNKQSGQVGTGQLLIFSGSIIVALIGGWFGRGGRTDTKLEIAKAEQTANVLAISQRVTASETKVDNLQTDVRDIKVDVKELLRRIK